MQRTEVLCARLDIDKNKHLSSDMVGYSRRQLKEVHVVFREENYHFETYFYVSGGLV